MARTPDHVTVTVTADAEAVRALAAEAVQLREQLDRARSAFIIADRERRSARMHRAGEIPTPAQLARWAGRAADRFEILTRPNHG